MKAAVWPVLLVALSCSTRGSSRSAVPEPELSVHSIAAGDTVRVQSALLGEGWHEGEVMWIMAPHVCLGVAVSSPRRIMLELGAIDRMEVRRSTGAGEGGAAGAAGGDVWQAIDLERIRRETSACGEARTPGSSGE